MDVTKPCKFLWLGDIHGPKPNECMGSRATMNLWISIGEKHIQIDSPAGGPPAGRSGVFTTSSDIALCSVVQLIRSPVWPQTA